MMKELFKKIVKGLGVIKLIDEVNEKFTSFETDLDVIRDETNQSAEKRFAGFKRYLKSSLESANSLMRSCYEVFKGYEEKYGTEYIEGVSDLKRVVEEEIAKHNQFISQLSKKELDSLFTEQIDNLKEFYGVVDRLKQELQDFTNNIKPVVNNKPEETKLLSKLFETLDGAIQDMRNIGDSIEVYLEDF